MNTVVLTALRITVVTWVLCGILYPFAVTGLGQLIFPAQANGSLLKNAQDQVIGSALIGQQWDAPQWFHGRPSATTDTDPKDPTKTVPAPYNAASSSGSNLGPTSQALSDRLTADRKALEKDQPELIGQQLPSDMLTTSASGLDPEISPANAMLQASRVAQLRGIPVNDLLNLVKAHTVAPTMGVFGEPRVNVMALNLALQKDYQAHQ
ncbi:potassium-transporting ATPase subunit KdpC [Pseudomonas sp. 6D_7.1_Bac1]|uniref:potassium-transporting ATPase subunit KdpC n=1 Tax=Pseudomonas sp. 6D_7.1_Bac1 TaxID=2971615 RepID=UPI0021CADACE|nr:potassium-transporting ATPase subunit KdpC [Pseudomonas sp. 6D_7.1_Bac1]MCU1749112.1 potassium-transporting ATPase subunit KdpC [Pseudomonas sp. 6D_7.1_Bac1]